MNAIQIIVGDCLTELAKLPAESVQCCVTSPPYWGLRDYGVEGQLGLEETPEEYVAKMVEVFREVRRVLRGDGTCWVNLGDVYAHGMPGGGCVFDNGRNDGRKSYDKDKARGREKLSTISPGLKPKDLCGIPWRLAFALQADGWYLRQDIIWQKPNPMPESVTDRCTKAHEYLFLLSKQARYFYDAEAIKDPGKDPEDDVRRILQGKNNRNGKKTSSGDVRNVLEQWSISENVVVPSRRNKRSVWTVPSAPYSEAHFATFPPDLIKPCILAGTSARGCCPRCGAPWERMVEKQHPPSSVFTKRNAPVDGKIYSGIQSSPLSERHTT